LKTNKGSGARKKLLGVRVDPLLHRTVKTYTASAGISMEKFVVDAIVNALERANRKEMRE